MDKFVFPQNFLWGAATSGHQVEGNNRDSDWWKWESEGKVKEPSGKACNHYNLFKEDFKLAKQLNHNAHRFSIEWSRIEPRQGSFNKEAIDHYREVINNLKGLSIEPIVTINHFTLPYWFLERGGWLQEESEIFFAAFVEKLVRNLGQNVKYWITLNEPCVYINASYIEGTWPPGHQSLNESRQIFVKLLKAHALSYNVIHGIYKNEGWDSPKVSIAKNIRPFSPYRKGLTLDLLPVKLRHYYYNELFIVSLLKGRCIAPGFPKTYLPVKKSLDFLGLNYYTRAFVRYLSISPSKIFGSEYGRDDHESKRNYLNWEIYPEGLYKVLIECSTYRLPILITENGICTDDDNERKDFIKEHIKNIARAIEKKVEVLGYLYWSLMDNFEWAEGYNPRFGLVGIDYTTQERSIRPSAEMYAKIIKENAI